AARARETAIVAAHVLAHPIGARIAVLPAIACVVPTSAPQVSSALMASAFARPRRVQRGVVPVPLAFLGAATTAVAPGDFSASNALPGSSASRESAAIVRPRVPRVVVLELRVTPARFQAVA